MCVAFWDRAFLKKSKQRPGRNDQAPKKTFESRKPGWMGLFLMVGANHGWFVAECRRFT